MFPLHPGHPGHETALIVAMAIVVLAIGFALTRDGWSRTGTLVGVAVLAGGLRVGLEAIAIHTHGLVHLVGHGLELSAFVAAILATYYAFDAWTSTSSALE